MLSIHPAAAATAAARIYAVRWSQLAIVAVAAALVSLFPTASANAQAGQCASLSPPCPTTPPLTVSFTNASTTVETLPAKVYFTVTGTQGNYAAQTANVNATVNGAAAYVDYAFDANFASLHGAVTLTSLNSTNTVAVSYSDGNGASGSASMTVTYAPPPPPPAMAAPIVTPEPNSRYRRSIGGCEGCVFGTASYSTPTYRSLDQDRGLTLTYSSVAAAPTVTVVLDVNVNSTTMPHAIALGFTRSNDSLALHASGNHWVYYTPHAGVNRIAAQLNVAGWGSGPHELTAYVYNEWPGTSLPTMLPITVLVADEVESPFGSGWGVAGLQRLYGAADGIGPAMVSDGVGNLTLFTNCGNFCWTAPPGEGSTLVHTGNGVIERRGLDGSVATFNAQGAQTSVRDRIGNTTTFGYDAAGRLATITDPAGQVIVLDYRAEPGPLNLKPGTLSGITVPGRWSAFAVDAAGDLRTMQDPDGLGSHALYSGHRMTLWQARTGGQTTFSYDAFGGLASVTAPPVTLANGTQAWPTTTFRSREAALLPPAAQGTTTATAWPVPDSAWIRITSPTGDSTLVLVNGEGNATHVRQRDPQGKLQTTTVKYNAAGQPEFVVGPDGGSVGYTWNGALLSSVKQGATLVEYEYNHLGQRKFTFVNGVLMEDNRYTSDGRWLLDRTITGTDTTSYSHDTRGRVATVRDPEGHLTTLTYEPAGFQNLRTTTRDFKTVTYGYDGNGRPSTVTNPAIQVTTTEYDLLGRVTRVVTPDTQASVWSYDDVNRVYTFTDPKGNRHATYTDAAGRVLRQEDPSYQNSHTVYDAMGRVAGWQDRNGVAGSIQYDVRGRPTTVSAGGVTTTTAYDSAGKWVAYTNAEGSDTLHIDGQGRLVKQVTVRGGKVFTMTGIYAEEGHRQRLEIEAGHWQQPYVHQFGVDTLLRPASIFAFGVSGSTITYNKDHLPHVVTVPTTSTLASRFMKTTSYTPDHGAWQETYSHWGGIVNRQYAYDSLDRVREIQRGDYTGDGYSARVATYDVMGRLKSYRDEQRWNVPVWVCNGPELNGDCYWEPQWQSSVERQESYTYDAAGNRTDNGAVVGGGNRTTSFGGFTLGYDGEGNLLSKTGNGVNQSFVWNAFGQLVSTTRNGVTTTFGYDGLGRRVRKTVGSSTMYYLHDGDNLVLQLDAAGNPQLEFSYYPGIDRPHSVKRSSDGARFYYVTEQPGHVTALVNTSNQLVNRYEYTPFGDAIAATEQVAQPFRFTGREWDGETGLYYYRARYYDPKLARFISEDPIGLEGGLNVYAYVQNDPVNRRDPSGLQTECVSWWTRGFTIRVGNVSHVEPGYWTTRCWSNDDSGGGRGHSLPRPSNGDDVGLGGGGGVTPGNSAGTFAKEALACAASGAILAASVGFDKLGVSSVVALTMSGLRAVGAGLGAALWQTASRVNAGFGARMSARLGARASAYAGGFAAHASGAAAEVYGPSAPTMGTWKELQDFSPFLTPQAIPVVHQMCPRGVTQIFY